MATTHARALCRSRAASAFRTGWACLMVGTIIRFAECHHKDFLAFPAFAYVTAVMVAGEASLGEALQGAAAAVCGTLQGVGPAMACLWAVGPGKLTVWTSTLAVALSAFVVALPNTTHIIAKRVAFAQMVIVYVVALIQGESMGAIKYPLHVGISTCVGAAASVLALLLPVPKLAYVEVQEKSDKVAQMVSEMVKLLVDSMCAENKDGVVASLSKVKSLATTKATLLQKIAQRQASTRWERPGKEPLPTLGMIKATEQALKGMEISLSSHLSLSTPSLTSHPILKDSLHQLTECTTQTLLNKPSPSTHQTAKQALYTLHHTLEPTSLSLHNLSSLFFIYCLCQLHSETTIPSQNRQSSGPKIAPTVEEPANPQSENHNSSIKTAYCKSLSFTNKESAIWALKCSLSLALSVLLGVLYSKDNGYWAGIGVAISMGATREPTFKLANVRTHGTVAGSIYGVLGCFLAQKIPAVRYIALIPWVIFTSFLRDSKMYGYAGSLSALIGAVIILGRRNFGAPPEFAIARITETFIGVVCYIFVELLIEPTRATRLARLELDRAMTELSGLILSVLFENRESHKEDEKRLRSCIFRLRKFVDEAKNEPDFWFFPFPSDIYTKILGSLCTMLELLSFWASGFEELAHVARAHGAQVDSLIEPVGSEIEWFKGSADSVLRCLAGVMGVGSLKEMSDEFGRVGTCGDLEAGGVTRVTMDEEEVEKMTKSFLENGREVGVGFSGEELKGQLVLCMGCLGFCMEGLMREMKELEKGVRELLEREGIDYSHETCCR